MKHKYTLEEAKETGRPPRDKGTRLQYEGGLRASAGIVESRGRHGRIKQPISDRVYLVLEGEGEFYFGGEEGQDEEMVRVGKDDVLLIPKGTVYDYEGRMRFFLAHAPAYEPDSDVHYDDLWE